MALADLVVILTKYEVEFIIVGGMAAVLRGTPVNTFDLDVVYDQVPRTSSVCSRRSTSSKPSCATTRGSYGSMRRTFRAPGTS